MRRKALLQNLLLVLASLIFAALLAEILLRLVLPSPIVWIFPQERYIFDQEIGHRLMPNQQSFTHDKEVSINSLGIRDAEYGPEPAPGVTRIIAIGDSQTFGNGITIADTWPKQLEHELSRLDNTRGYEVLNAGLPASDTWQHEILLQQLMSTYNPDVVVLAFYVNDIVSKPDSVNNSQSDDIHATSREMVYLLKQSSLLLSLRAAYDAVMQIILPRHGVLLQNALLAGESSAEIDRRWEQVEWSLSKMKEVTDRYNVGFLVISLPRRDQVDGRLQANKYNSRLSAVMNKAEVRFMNLLGPLQQAFKDSEKALFIPWDGHNTAIANRVVAREVAPIIPGLSNGRTGLSGHHGNDGEL